MSCNGMVGIIKKKMLKKGGPDGSLRPGMSMKKLVTNSSIVCPKNVIKIWTFYKKKDEIPYKIITGKLQRKTAVKHNIKIPSGLAGRDTFINREMLF